MPKNSPYRFTLGFDAQDPEHQMAVEILNRLGHKKARFIVKAVLFYQQQKDFAVANHSISTKKNVIEKESRVVRLDEDIEIDAADIETIQKNRDFLKELEEE